MAGMSTLDDGTDSLFADCGLRTTWHDNSCVCRPSDASALVAWSTYQSDPIAAAVHTHNVHGAQFHPETSPTPGVVFVHQFADRFARDTC
jgi:imidazoleglycerol phosphate synthase glutamine amidotransferase subunit HisH